ncbi:hypothetical protein [Streptomyces sp. NPDC006335]|uniref:AlbA family DNA-binding domain-containing protein n=1 Tax=Streptomyces sp. NPDC006335 TaxID=3156895 RepID=UPI0033BB8B56
MGNALVRVGSDVMAADSMVQLVSYLAEQQPREILGTPESEWVDFKSVPPEGPYDLSTDKGKFELAKDVAAFSNALGGLIVCGFKARKKQTELHEVAERSHPSTRRWSIARSTRTSSRSMCARYST